MNVAEMLHLYHPSPNGSIEPVPLTTDPADKSKPAIKLISLVPRFTLVLSAALRKTLKTPVTPEVIPCLIL